MGIYGLVTEDFVENLIKIEGKGCSVEILAWCYKHEWGIRGGEMEKELERGKKQ